MFSSTSSLATVALLAIPAVQAHMGLWHPSVYGFNKGDQLVYPLAGKSWNDWWFHGYINDQPKETMSVPAGKDLTVQIACSKAWTTYGNKPTDAACPNDSGSYHAGGHTGSGGGWNGNQDNNLMGCALAIAYKSNPWDVKPEDFTIMSVQEQCVRQRDTTFAIPTNLPACPEGGCTCSWFWAGKNSATEMYMNAFKCDVKGGVIGGNVPRAQPPRKGKVDGPTQPFYFANDVNNLGFEADWGNKPSYNSAWGWKNGAQEKAFGGSGNGSGNGGNNGNNGNGNGNGGNKDESWKSTTTKSKQPEQTKNTSNNNSNGHEDFQNLAASPTPAKPAPGKCTRRSRRKLH